MSVLFLVEWLIQNVIGSINSWNFIKTTGYIFIIILSGVRLSPLGTASTTGLFYQLQMIDDDDDDDCGAIGGMKIGRGNPSTRRKHAPAPL
jgi:hypothetical protein